MVVTGAIAIFFSARFVRRPVWSPEFWAGALFARFGAPVAWLRRRIQRGDRDERAAHGGGATARVLVRTADGAELQVPVHNSQLSVGASPQCDVTLSGAEVRFVHMILTNVDPDAYRVFRFGPVAREQGGIEISDDEVIAAGEWIRVGEHFVSVEATRGASGAA